MLSLANKKGLSESERERRGEDDRRRKRKDEVVIGRTSAKEGERDFDLDPSATQQDYLHQASKIEREIFQQTEVGLELLNSFQLEKADRAFGRVFELKPDAYLWQAGIVKYYLGDMIGAAKIFADSARKFESRFGGLASEERIWRDACELHYWTSLPKGVRAEMRKTGGISSLFPILEGTKEQSDSVPIESRKVMKLALELFSSTMAGDKARELLARAKLCSIGGSDQSAKADRKMWKLTSWFYLGLHYDSLGFDDDGKKCMKAALRFGPSVGKSDDIVHTLPLLHMTVREWFDDDDFETEIAFDNVPGNGNSAFSPVTPNEAVFGMAHADPFIEKSIKEDVLKMKLRELKDTLRLRGKTTTGSKWELQERLFFSLMDDAGFASGFAP